MARGCLVAVALPLLLGARAHISYQGLLPNGASVQRGGQPWPAVGHAGADYTPEKNAFGAAFAAAGKKWTRALCLADADGDGQSNGLELGDPDCAWAVGAVPARLADISHPGFADSTTAVGPTPPSPSTAGPSATSTVEPTSMPAGPGGCAPSQLFVTDDPSRRYACSLPVAAGLQLHWRVDPQGASVDLALEKRATSSWLALGFPRAAGRMQGAHAAVAQDGTVRLQHLVGYDAASFEEVPLGSMPVAFSRAVVVTEGGSEVLSLSEVRFQDLRQAVLIFARRDDCAWPCGHAGGAADRGGVSVNLLTGSSTADGGEAAEGEVVRRAAVLAGLAALLLLAGVGAAVGWLPAGRGRPPRRPLRQSSAGWSPAGTAGVVAALACLVAVAAPVMALHTAAGEREVVVGLGLAAGLAALIPVWLAFWKAGLHRVLALSREAAWRVHGVFGAIFLLFGTAHGAVALDWAGWSLIYERTLWLVGLIGLCLLWLGVLPGMLHAVAPGAMPYDAWKILHYLSVLGYILAVVHMIGHAAAQAGSMATLLAALNCLAVVAFGVQRLYTSITVHRVQIERVKVITEQKSQHVILDLDAPAFKYAAGQWARLHVPGFAPVAHPFTVVPGAEQGRISIIAKATGRFTRTLAEAGDSLKGRKVRLEGPYGSPPLEAAAAWARAVVFVVGGVGVTPALSLAARARSLGLPVRLFWTVRSPGLLRHCKTSLEAQVAPEHLSVWLTGVAAAEDLRWQPAGGRPQVGEWLAAVAGELCVAGQAGPVLLFVCGPAGLAAAARRGAAAAGQAAGGVEFHVHEEQFQFLPGAPCGQPTR